MIKVSNLRKHFGTKAAVDGVSFGLEKGEILGFLGPNGAGKSTTMRIVTGFLPPTAGEVRIGQFDVEDHPVEAKRLIGYLPENAPCYSDMTVRGFLRFCGEARGLQGTALGGAVDRAIATCFLEPVVHQNIDTLSKGYRHRTCLAQAILHDPPVLVLDEPTDGLDPNQKHEVRALIRRMGRDKAIVFSTHILEEVEAVCTRAIIIDRGRIVANGTPEELKQRAPGAGAVVVRVAGARGSVLKAVLERLDGRAGVVVVEETPAVLRVLPNDSAEAHRIAGRIHEISIREKWMLEELRVEDGRLDDVFRSITLPDSAPRQEP
ncbi:MAG: ATP-binding cassette domain-containing protein [Chthoniobacterales bacterium]|nr:ATP-binding cassette domain-containing protein [Chthoniobacterales bacterium]